MYGTFRKLSENTVFILGSNSTKIDHNYLGKIQERAICMTGIQRQKTYEQMAFDLSLFPSKLQKGVGAGLYIRSRHG